MNSKKKKPPALKKSIEIYPIQDSSLGGAYPLIRYIGDIKGMYLLLFFIFLIQLVVYRDYIFLKKLYLFLDIGSDSYNLFYPWFIQSARYLRTDGIPTWSFSNGMGESDFPGGLGSPFFLILAAMGPDNLAYGIIYVELLKMALTGVLCYLFLSVTDFSKYTAIVGGVLASCIGYIVLGSSGWYGHSANVLYFFLLMYAFELFYKKNNPILFPVAVFFVASDPFRLYMYSIFLFTYAVLRLTSENRLSFKASIIFLLKLGGLGAIGVGMSAVFSLGALIEKINSPRVSGDVSAIGSLAAVPVFGFPNRLEAVTVLLRFFSNDLMGTGSDFKGCLNYLEAPIFYSGLLPLLLAPQILLFDDKRKRIVFGVFFLAWMIPLAFPFFRYALYAFMGSYFKHGLSMFIPAITLLYGLNGLEIIQKRDGINFAVLAATLMALLTILYLPYFNGTSYAKMGIINKDIRIAITCFLIAYTGVLCFIRFESVTSYVKGVVLILICIEIGWFSFITVNHRTAITSEQFESRTGYNDYTIDAVDYLKAVDNDFYRINKDYSSSLAEVNSINDAKVQGYFGTPSYSSFNKPEYIEFLKATEIIPKGKESKTRWAIGLLQRPFLQGIASVKYNLLKNEDFAERDNFFKIIYENIASFGDVTVLKNNFFLPLGFTYNQSMLVKDYELLSKTHKDMAMFCAVVMDKKLPQLESVGADEMAATVKKYTLADFSQIVSGKRADAMKMTSFTQKHITGVISIDEPELLFFSIPVDTGWQAYDNGNPVELIKANIGFMGILLDKGEHHIELKYRVNYIRITLSVSIASLIIYLMFIFRYLAHVKLDKK